MQKTDEIEDLGLQIVVLDRGFIYVGVTQIMGDFYLIHKAACVRKWGTNNGLGELAEKGPMKETVLDPSPLVRAERKAVLFNIQCNTDHWKKYLSGR